MSEVQRTVTRITTLRDYFARSPLCHSRGNLPSPCLNSRSRRFFEHDAAMFFDRREALLNHLTERHAASL